jgi:UDP-3-O-[3-hydroxymyristoyl] glucosamine N-acyltransferase
MRVDFGSSVGSVVDSCDSFGSVVAVGASVMIGGEVGVGVEQAHDSLSLAKYTVMIAAITTKIPPMIAAATPASPDSAFARFMLQTLNAMGRKN